ncbi:mycofactocin-coupled SDR family oxidoreductase [Mycobacterium sp.]|jgi:SDR family mycofactocin-dependent oxidoreductase|uniref:mycofactocin-coupled SDR family oxidoreductase n=1 Tax=Mycobacterium sp. TaxID=1785 RepID=UPI00334179DB|nr:NAD(P)-dependent oxidoreductase [Mycobacterium sp.]
MGKLDGKVAFITGAGRGQGRSHAIRLAEEGADIIAVDICKDEPALAYSLATEEDLEATAKLVADTGRRIVTRQTDVRDIVGLRTAFDEGVAELGSIDIVIANAGVVFFDQAEVDDDADDLAWEIATRVMLDGVRNTIKVSRKALVDGGRGGSIVIISSTAGLKGMSDGSGGGDGYTAAKHGVVGLMRTYANLLGPHGIRVNTVHPAGVLTPMIMNDGFTAWTESHRALADRLTNLLPVQAMEPVDISNAVLWLVSDEGRYVTGVALPVDAGFTARV